MPIRIRAARRADLPAVYDVLDRAFDAPVQLFIDQTEGDSTMRLRQVRVAEVDGRILAHVRIFARTMLVRGVPVRTGGIGSVAAHPDARGAGLPTALLNDAIDVMHRDGTLVSFLFTGIPAFYERLGWRIVREPYFVAEGEEAAVVPHDRRYAIRRIDDGDVRALLAIYRRATAGTTGAIVRTARTWRDAQAWLGEDTGGCLVAEWNRRPVAYIRGRSRGYGYDVLEAEHLRGHDAALAALLARAGQRARSRRQRIIATAPDDSTLAVALRTLPSTVATGMPGLPEADVAYPMMMRVVSLEGTLAALLPQVNDRADRHRGAAFTLGLTGADGESVTVEVTPTKARLSRRAPDFALDGSATLDALLGQRKSSALARPRPPAAVAKRIDALLPPAALHFWNSDRI